MRNTLRRIAFGMLGTGMVVTMALGASTAGASAAVSAPRAVAVAAHPHFLKWPIVRRGDHGARVGKIQLLLNQHGIPVKVDAYYGRATVLAVKFFQKKNHIYPTGVVGAKTWEKLIVTVWKGWRGPAVTAVQFELHYIYGYKFVTVDGAFGQKSEWAVTLFQKRYHLRPDGIVGPATWNALVVHEK